MDWSFFLTSPLFKLILVYDIRTRRRLREILKIFFSGCPLQPLLICCTNRSNQRAAKSVQKIFCRRVLYCSLFSVTDNRDIPYQYEEVCKRPEITAE